MFSELLRGIKDRLIYAVVISLASGLVAGQILGPSAGRLKVLVLPVLFIMIYPMMINIRLGGVFEALSDVRVVGLSLAINFVAAPLLAVVIADTFFSAQPLYAVGLYLIALIPTSGMTAAWTGLAKGDLNSALIMMAVNLIVAVFVLPIYLDALVSGTVQFDPRALFVQLAKVVFVPMVAGNLTRRAIVRRSGLDGLKALKPTLGGISSLGVTFIVFIAMALRSTQILAEPVTSATTVVPLVVFYGVILAVGTVVGRLFLTEAKAIALVYATSMRNLSIAVAIAVITYPEAVLPIALAYVIQPPLGAVYMHFQRDFDGSFDRVLARAD